MKNARSCSICTLLLFDSPAQAHASGLLWQPAAHYDNGQEVPTCPGCAGSDRLAPAARLAFQEAMNLRLGCDERGAVLEATEPEPRIAAAYRVYLSLGSVNKTARQVHIGVYTLIKSFNDAGYAYPVAR